MPLASHRAPQQVGSSLRLLYDETTELERARREAVQAMTLPRNGRQLAMDVI
jgi:hypothetical protein